MPAGGVLRYQHFKAALEGLDAKRQALSPLPIIYQWEAPIAGAGTKCAPQLCMCGRVGLALCVITLVHELAWCQVLPTCVYTRDQWKKTVAVDELPVRCFQRQHPIILARDICFADFKRNCKKQPHADQTAQHPCHCFVSHRSQA